MTSIHSAPRAETITVGRGDQARDIAILARSPVAATSPAAPGLVWLGGYRSDMSGTKALEMDALAAEKGLAAIRFDYSGHGASGGAFRQGTISRCWKKRLPSSIMPACRASCWSARRWAAGSRCALRRNSPDAAPDRGSPAWC